MDKGRLVEVKATIRSLLVSAAHSMSIGELQRDFRSFMGFSFPHTSLGFKSAEDLLRALPDVVTVLGYGSHALVQAVKNEKTQHIADLVKDQRTSCTKRRKRVLHTRGRRRSQRPTYAPEFRKFDVSSDSLDERFGRLTLEDCGPLPSQKIRLSSSSISSPNGSEMPFNKMPAKSHQIIRSPNKTQEQTKDANAVKDEKFMLNEAIKPQPSQTMPQPSQTMPQTKKVIHKRFNIVYGSQDNSTAKDANTMHDTKNQLNGNQSATELTMESKTAEKCIEKPLNACQTSPTEMASNEKSCKSIIYLGTRRYVIDKSTKSSNDKEEAIPEDAVTDNIKKFDMSHKNIDIDKEEKDYHEPPKKAVTIPQNEMYGKLFNGSVISLFMSEIYHPLLFFFHIDEDDGHELIRLEKEMVEFYSPLGMHNYNHDISELKVGLICAAEFGRSWYRVKVISVPLYMSTYSKVKVMFIDYGSLNEIPIRHIKILVPKFHNIPIQAIRGRLANIERNKTIRSTRAINYFNELVNDRCLFGYVTDVDTDTPSVDLVLVDTSDNKSKCNINKTLITTGYAKMENIN